MENKIPWDKITVPKQSFVERALGERYRKRGEKFITASIKQHAVTEDGQVDNELADYIRKKLTQRTEVSIQRDVVEAAGWVLTSGAATGAAAMVISKQMEGKFLTRTSVFATVAGTALGGMLDLYRMNRRFDSAMKGELTGALRAMREERGPLVDKHRTEDAHFRALIEDDGKGGGFSR